jgi:hypothetical protein
MRRSLHFAGVFSRIAALALHEISGISRVMRDRRRVSDDLHSGLSMESPLLELQSLLWNKGRKLNAKLAKENLVNFRCIAGLEKGLRTRMKSTDLQLAYSRLGSGVQKEKCLQLLRLSSTTIVISTQQP